MTENAQCKCRLDCDHHKGRPCTNSAKTLPARRIVDRGEQMDAKAVRLGYCDACLSVIGILK